MVQILNERQDKAVDIIERLNELDVDWTEILIPIINGSEIATDYIIANYEHILTDDW